MTFLLMTGWFVLDATVAMSGEPENSKGRVLASSATVALGLKVGYRVDQFDWNIAGNNAGTNPNILSELTWDDLEIYQVQLNTKLSAGNSRRDGYRYHFRGMIGWGHIFNGENQDSDYAGDDRTLEFSRSNNSADDGNVFDVSAGAGIEFSTFDGRWTLIPMGGYSYHEQNLQITDGVQTLSDQGIADDFFGTGAVNLPSLGPFEGLDSRYDTKWYGPWLGVELTFQPVDRWRVTGLFEYHWTDYEGKANWNLRQNLEHPVSFRHWAEGAGAIYGLDLNGKLNQSWSCDLSVSYLDWDTDAGDNTTYLANGGSVGTRVNEVNWTSFAVMAGLTRRF